LKFIHRVSPSGYWASMMCWTVARHCLVLHFRLLKFFVPRHLLRMNKPKPMTDNTQLENDIHTLWSLIFEIVIDMEKRLFAHLAAHGLTPPQFYVLKTLTEHGGRCRIGQIAAEHHLTNATMTGLVKRLESMSPALVCRETSSSDGRAVDVLLTPAGVARYADVQRTIMAQLELVFGLLPADEREQIMEKARFYFGLVRQFFPVANSELLS
jgi:DNA-binding MarR family transcriptional regulator